MCSQSTMKVRDEPWLYVSPICLLMVLSSIPTSKPRQKEASYVIQEANVPSLYCHQRSRASFTLRHWGDEAWFSMGRWTHQVQEHELVCSWARQFPAGLGSGTRNMSVHDDTDYHLNCWLTRRTLSVGARVPTGNPLGWGPKTEGRAWDSWSACTHTHTHSRSFMHMHTHAPTHSNTCS